MKANNIGFICLIFAVLMTLTIAFTACEEKKNETAKVDDKAETVTDNNEKTPDAEQSNGENETDGENGTDAGNVGDELEIIALPTLPEEIHTSYFNKVTYLTSDGRVVGGGTALEDLSISMRLPEGVTCFEYRGDGVSSDWGLALYKVEAEADVFAENGYYVTENTVDGRFAGFGDVSEIKTYSLSNCYLVMEEKISYFGGGVGYNFYVRVDGEYIVRMSVAEANEADVDTYRAVVASFEFSGATE